MLTQDINNKVLDVVRVGQLFLQKSPKIMDIAVVLMLGRLAYELYKYDRKKRKGDVDMPDIFSKAYLKARGFLYIHHAQVSDWDCGLACAYMVRQWALGDQVTDLMHETCPENQIISVRQGKPLWTIDILLTLNQIGVDASMFTLARGVEAHHYNYEWYSETVDEDVYHVRKAFELAEAKSLPVCHAKISLLQLQHSLKDPSKVVAVILINNIGLYSENGLTTAAVYKGHYLLLLVYDPSDDTFLFLDPADSAKYPTIMRISSKSLEEARTHPGTDQDIIFCYRSNRCCQ